MKFERVVQVSREVGQTRSRTRKSELVAAALREAAGLDDAGSTDVAPTHVAPTDAAHPDDARLVASYLSGELPQRRTGIGWRSLTSLPPPATASVRTVREIDGALTAIAALRGPGSAARRTAAVTELFAALNADEQRYLADLLTGQVRQGALDGVLLAAIAKAAQLPEAVVRRAVMLAGNPSEVVGVALADGAAGLAAIGLAVGRPLRPMLAGSAPDVPAAMAQVGAGQPVALERKLDGIRLQVHKSGTEVRLYTRSLEEITARLPEVVHLVSTLPARTLVADAEAIALRPDGRPEPFQVTGARTASRGDPAELAAKVPVTTYLFDLLHLDGADLLDEPAAARIEALAGLLPPGSLIPRMVTADPQQGAAFFAEQVAAGHEGVVVKSLQAPYAAGRRGAGWVKVKPRHTLDLVVLAVEWGSGRRRGTLSNIHLGAADPDSPTGFTMLGKTFKGMTDEMLAWQTERFLALETGRDGHIVHVRPEQVVEIAFDGLQRSSRYPGGLALRFARVLRYRDDKQADQADALTTVRSLAQ
ncbi:DNA ligase-1 [Kineosphaera limosa]|uniref:DNA ligase B n=1 Tax=Kineosphaera limosa NBRC 100340 TaxID=1184609 RepID=K6X0P2_9MICO|nr:ATP-dependent DNA ligase [Kineosphaera limosa]NYE00408.1 DNA ligase-1 [Kineosphaera limosa]GAB97922.1 ATP-dependent DNA ligase LigB [Kineosphaera limosa NBRC 100340]